MPAQVKLMITLYFIAAGFVFLLMAAAMGTFTATATGAHAVPAAHIDVCGLIAAQVYETQDYTGSATERACLGEEDDARVGLALDYGQTVNGYALSEAAER